MANVKLTDIINPVVYQTIEPLNNPEKSQLFQSGILVRNEYMDMMADGGNIGELIYWNDLNPDTEPNYSNDNPADLAVPEAVNQGFMLFRKVYENKGYSAADLVADLTKKNPMQHIRNRFGTYWMRSTERRVWATMAGVYADNVANDASDMVVNIAGATNADIDAGTVISAEAVTAAAFTMGDARQSLRAIVVHPILMKRMIDEDRIDYLQDSKGMLTIPTYLGLRVIESEQVPYTAAAGTGPTDAAAKYTSILFGESSIAYGEGNPLYPVEIEREARQGTGGGVTTLWERKELLVHPIGFSFTSNTVTGTSGQNPIVSANWADLRLAANWDRKVYRKQAPFAFLVTNG